MNKLTIVSKWHKAGGTDRVTPMFTAVAHKNLADAEGYFRRAFWPQNDYYAAGESGRPVDRGQAAERLG